MRPAKVCLLTFFVLLASCLPALAGGVRVWQDSLEIPTYLLGAEDPNPPFPMAGQRNVYPYTLLDDLTDRREAKTYKAVFLENDFLKAIVLPELGGHLYSLYDKVNKREVFYRNNVVKYGLVALRGAWVSGGVEFNFPNGHTTVTVSPIAYTTMQNPDGSATVVVGDIDLVTGMHWEVALTLRPGAARLEQHVTLFNDTGLTHPFWYWANAAVAATQDMRFNYPMREANPHSHEEIWTFPIHNGVDYSWYKNIRQPTSLFGRDVHRNFFGAYYVQSDSGVVHVADYREVLGKKTWTWGTADDGLIWTDLLTDHDGAYNEIQAGRFETQLASEFMPPRRVVAFDESWYPVEGLGGGFVEATTRLALNVVYSEGSAGVPHSAEVVLFSTQANPGVRVRATLGGQVLKEFGPVALEPMQTLKVHVPVADVAAAKRQIAVTVTGMDGQVLLHWSAADPIDGNPDFVPASGVHGPPAKDAAAMSVEELFLSGVDLEKAGDAEGATDVYFAVLKRDPAYVPALVKMAWHNLTAGDFTTAEGFITPALARDGRNPETLYAAGVVYRAAHRWSLAQDMFWAAIRFGGELAPVYAQLGEIAITQHDYERAIALLGKTLQYNPGDAIAATDLALALRLAGRAAEAEKTIDGVLARMPLLPYARAERPRILAVQEGAVAPAAVRNNWSEPYPAASEPYLQVAAWYRTLNDLPDSDAVLRDALAHLPAPAVSPLVYYYLAANARDRGEKNQAEEFGRQGEGAPYDKVFPNRLADAEVIDSELHSRPLDAHATYFMGNFLFAHGRYEEGAHYWTEAFAQGFEYSVLMRNLGLYAWHLKNDLPDAAQFYEKAVKLAPDDYRLYTDLDEIYFRLGSTSQREKLFANAPEAVLSRDTVLARRAMLLAEQTNYDAALALLVNHRFKPWEGGALVHEIYAMINLQQGITALSSNNPVLAEAAFRRGLEYPHNLGSGQPDKPRRMELWFWLGEALHAEGKMDAARDAWTKTQEEGQGHDPLAVLYRGLAEQRFGQEGAAAETLALLVEVKPGGKYSAAEFYASGLLDFYARRREQAVSKFRAALDANPDFWQARFMMERTTR